MGWNYLLIPKLQWCNHWSLGMDKSWNPTFYRVCYYLSTQGWNLIHVTKRDPEWSTQLQNYGLPSYLRCHTYFCINLLWLTDIIWRHQSGSTMTAPSHYLDQCWLMINQGFFLEMLKLSVLEMSIKICSFKITAISPRDQWVKWMRWYHTTV